MAELSPFAKEATSFVFDVVAMVAHRIFGWSNRENTYEKGSDSRDGSSQTQTLFNTRAGAHGHVISHICISDFLLKTHPRVTPKHLKLQIYQIPIMSAVRYQDNRVWK